MSPLLTNGTCPRECTLFRCCCVFLPELIALKPNGLFRVPFDVLLQNQSPVPKNNWLGKFKMMRNLYLSLILALALILSTLIGVFAENYGMSPISGPFLFATALLVTGFVLWLTTRNTIKIAIISVIFAGSLMIAAVLAPADANDLLPILGAGAAFSVLQCQKHEIAHCC